MSLSSVHSSIWTFLFICMLHSRMVLITSLEWVTLSLLKFAKQTFWKSCFSINLFQECATAPLSEDNSNNMGLLLFVILVPLLFLLTLIGLFLVGVYNFKQVFIFILSNCFVISPFSYIFVKRELNKIRSDLVIEREMLRVNMLTGLKEEFINTPAVSVIETLRRIRTAKSIVLFCFVKK